MQTPAVTANGDSAPLVLGAGMWAMEITGVWDGATAALKESGGTSTFVASDDPYNTGSPVSRTADGPTLDAFGGKSFLITVSGAGAATSLSLIARRAASC